MQASCGRPASTWTIKRHNRLIVNVTWQNMRTTNYTVADVEHFAQYFAPLTFDPDATRELHFQATSFYWSDEMPEFVDDDYDASLRHFMIYLLSYRKVLMYGEGVAEFEPIWNRLMVLCPDWPGFRSDRMTPNLIRELELQVDHELDRLERACNVRKRRVAHKKRLAEKSAIQPRVDDEAT